MISLSFRNFPVNRFTQGPERILQPSSGCETPTTAIKFLERAKLGQHSFKTKQLGAFWYARKKGIKIEMTNFN